MSKTTIKSIGAVLAGFIFIVITHTATDALLKSAGVLPKDHLFGGSGFRACLVCLDAGGDFIADCLAWREAA
jgi:hypothetical protein